MREAGRQLANNRELRRTIQLCCLLANFVFRVLLLRNVVTNRYVVMGFVMFIKKRNDRRIDPIDRAVFRAVANLTLPNLAAGNRSPQVANEFFRVIVGIDDAVILSQQFLARVL